jgi:DNA-binding protein HU-beta
MRIFNTTGLSFILVLSMFCGSVLAMNKAELIDAMANDAGLSKGDAGNVLNAFVGATSDALKKGDRIALVGFGAFSVTRQMSSSSACHVTREVTFIPASTFNASDSTQETPFPMAVLDPDSDGDTIPDDDVVHVDGKDNEAFVPTGEIARQESKVEVRGWNPTAKKKKSVKSSKKTVDVVARSMPPVNTICENGEYEGRIIQDKEMLVFMDILSGESSENLVPAYDTLLGTIIRVVNSGEEVDIEEFGIFHNSDVVVITVPARKGRNPQTGKEIQIKAKGLSQKEISMLTDAARRAARTGRNPQTGKEIQIKAKKVAKFKAGAALADSVK